MDFLDIKKAIGKTLGLKKFDLEYGYPPNIELGDLAIPCFGLSKELKVTPNEVAHKLARGLRENKKLNRLIANCTAAGPYLNLKLQNPFLLDSAKEKIDAKNWRKLLPRQKTMVEFLSPNTNKPLHLGHLRNACLGDALANILSACGQKVIKANLINDRGIHICKSMLAWQKWGDNSTPMSAEKKGDHFVGDWYVKFSQESEKDPNLIVEAQNILQKWEENDPATIKLWQTMNQWVLNGFAVTLARLGIDFDKIYFESQTYKLGKNIIAQGLKKGIFIKQTDNSLVFKLPEAEFGLNKDGSPKLLLVQRADGTSVYMTQDIGTSIMKVKEFGLDQSIYVVGSEQDYHFKCLFAVLKALGYGWAGQCHHLSYGMVSLPEGKMKSREGNVVDADDLMEEMHISAKKVLQEKNPDLSEEELSQRAEIIGLGGMKFFLLLSSPKTDIKYDPAASISLDGLTATYCQYAAVRATNVLVKARAMNIKVSNSTLPENTELPIEAREVLIKLWQLPEKIKDSALSLDPSVLARQIYEISKSFNQFYNNIPILKEGANPQMIQAGLMLSSAVKTAITQGLKLLGINTPEKM